MIGKVVAFMSVVVALSIMIITAQGFQSVNTCVNETHMISSLVIDDNGTVSIIEQPAIPCPHGCVDNIGRYGADCLNPPQAMPMEFYLIILGLAAVLLFVGYAKKRWFASMVSTVLFLFIAFQSFNVTIMSQAYYLPSFAVLAWMASIVGTGVTMVGAVQYVREVMRKKDEEREKLETR